MKYRRIRGLEGKYKILEEKEKVKTKVGEIYGWLTILEREGIDKHGAVIWKCRCKCGNFASVRGYHMKRGCISSCGCLCAQTKIKSSIKFLEKWGYEVTKKQV